MAMLLSFLKSRRKDLPVVNHYHAEPHAGIFSYNDGRELSVRTIVPNCPPQEAYDYIARLTLFYGSRAEAIVVHQPKPFASEKDRAFWSAGMLAEKGLIPYLDAATAYIKVHEALEDRVGEALLGSAKQIRKLLKNDAYPVWSDRTTFPPNY